MATHTLKGRLSDLEKMKEMLEYDLNYLSKKYETSFGPKKGSPGPWVAPATWPVSPLTYPGVH